MQRTSTNLLLGTGLVVMWSSGFVGAELGARATSTNTLLTWRFLVITVLLIGWIGWRHRARLARAVRNRTARTPAAGTSAAPHPGDPARGPRWLGSHALIGALAQAGYLYGVYAAAEYGVAAGTSALIAGLQPIVGAAVAAPLLGERVHLRQIVGLGLGLVGVTVVVSGDLALDTSVPLAAYALPFGAMLSLVAGTVLERRLRPGGDLPEVLAVQCGVSALLFTPMAVASGTFLPPADGLFWFAVAWVVLLSTLGGYGFYWAVLARGGVTRVSALLYLTPPTTTLWAWLMLGRPVTWMSLLGLAISAVAVGLIHYARRPRRRIEHGELDGRTTGTSADDRGDGRRRRSDDDGRDPRQHDGTAAGHRRPSRRREPVLVAEAGTGHPDPVAERLPRQPGAGG